MSRYKKTAFANIHKLDKNSNVGAIQSKNKLTTKISIFDLFRRVISGVVELNELSFLIHDLLLQFTVNFFVEIQIRNFILH